MNILIVKLKKCMEVLAGSGQSVFVKWFRLLLLPMILLALVATIMIIGSRDGEIATLTGGAEAVMTTKPTVIDGIWDTRRYSDELYNPMGLAVSEGNLIIADSMCDRIQVIDGFENQRVGRPGQYGVAYLDSGGLQDGYRESALFMKPSDVAVAPGGDVIICDTGNHVIRRMDDTYVTTIAGNGYAGYADGQETEAQFASPRSVVVDSSGAIYVADTMNHCIRRIDVDGNVTLYAGVPGEAGYQDGAAEQAHFSEPSGLALSDDILYVADAGNHCIRKIADGSVSTITGAPGVVNEDTGYPQGGYVDGGYAEARFNFPRDIALLSDGSLAVADSMNHAVRLIGADTVHTLVGGGEDGQFYEAAENLRITRPEGICAGDDILYISDTLNNRVVGIPLTERMREGRPSREKMLADTGVTTTSDYAYRGEIRVFMDGRRIDMGRVQPWNTHDHIYVPIRPFFEALGGTVVLNEDTGMLTVTIQAQQTRLTLDQDYFILKGIAVTTTEEIMRLFPYPLEWYPEFSLIALHVPSDLMPENLSQEDSP